MKAELQQKLFDKYPVMFKHRNRKLEKGGIILPIDFGVETGSGWYWLISNLLECIHSYVSQNEVPEVTITQIKEKYGSLRFYFTGGNDMVYGMVWLAEDMSEKICEECGSTEGILKEINGWWSTRCKNCRKNEK